MSSSFNLSTFHVIIPKNLSFSTAEVRISTNAISFNIAAAAELNYPYSVCLMASEDGSQLAIKPWDCPDESIPFCTEEFRQSRKRIAFKDKDFVSALRAELGWNDKRSRCANGILYRSPGILLFELDKATLIGNKNKEKTRPKLENYPTLAQVMSTLKPRALALGPAQ